MGFHDSVKNLFFSKHQDKIIFVPKLMNSRSRMTLKQACSEVLSSDFLGLKKTSAASLTSAATLTSLASTYFLKNQMV
jgi:hypothetical protein